MEEVTFPMDYFPGSRSAGGRVPHSRTRSGLEWDFRLCECTSATIDFHIGTAQVTFVPPHTRIFLPPARWPLYTFTEDRGICVPSHLGPGRHCPQLFDNSPTSHLH